MISSYAPFAFVALALVVEFGFAYALVEKLLYCGAGLLGVVFILALVAERAPRGVAELVWTSALFLGALALGYPFFFLPAPS